MPLEALGVAEAPTYARLRRELEPHLEEFARCRSTAALRRLPSYRAVAEQVAALLATIDTGDFRRGPSPAKRAYRIVAWNIERGRRLAEEIEAFRSDPRLRDADVILVTEADIGMARSNNHHVPREMARELGFAYAFAPCYFSLVKGSGVEYHVDGQNELGLHGNAVFSRYPIRSARGIPLVNGVDKMKGREKRLGRQAAVATEIEFPNLTFLAVSVHLDMQSTQRHRRDQMCTILDALPANGPAVLGGDWNTSTYDSSHAIFAGAGFWRRVLMGIDNAIHNHYLHPERWFERGLFRLLESRGFDYRRCNLMGERTTYYDLSHDGHTGSLSEWIPDWYFPFIHWSLRNHDQRCPFKLDWFTTREVQAENPFVIHDYPHLSDHDPIGIDISATPVER